MEHFKGGRDGDHGPISRGTVCTITMPKDRDAMTHSHLRALICNTYQYKNTGVKRYKVCTEHDIIQGTLEREQLELLPHMRAAGIGVYYAALDKTKFITPAEASKRYTLIVWKVEELLRFFFALYYEIVQIYIGGGIHTPYGLDVIE